MRCPALYEIEHVSRYLYSSPVQHCALSLCLKPRNDAQQRLLNFDVATVPTAPLNSAMDSFGNTKHFLNIHQEHEALEVTARSTVERKPPVPLPDSLCKDAWGEIRSWAESFTHWDFTHPSALAGPSPALTALVDELDIRPGCDPLGTLLGLSDTLYRSFRYVPGSTSAVSPIEHILESRQGVCQDYAHVMVAIARSWCIPSRYVSGYLYMGGQDGKEESSQRATHAWVECLLPDLGWIGFDPTNRCQADERHVPVAVGRDYQDVAPVKGIFLGGGESRLEVDVRVRAG